MSRIGYLPITIPAGVTLSIIENTVTVKGPKGELTQEVSPKLKLELEDGTLNIARVDEEKQTKAYHGLYRSLINNMVVGVSEGYEQKLELVGVGYRTSNNGQVLELSLGYSHPIILVLPNEITVEAKTERNQVPFIKLQSADKQLLGQVCAKIRSFRKLEPYKGKGIKFPGEYVRRKAGKTAAK